MAAILGPGDHLWQHILPQMVRGTYFGGTICGITDHKKGEERNKDKKKDGGRDKDTQNNQQAGQVMHE